MKIRTVSYRRTKQVAKFEPEVIELTIDLSPGENAHDAITAARQMVDFEFGESDCIPCICDIEVIAKKQCICGGNLH